MKSHRRDVHAVPRTLQLSVPGFDVVAGVHAAESTLARHTHDLPTICAVQRGRFTEYYPGKAVDCDARTLKVTPAGEPHWNRFEATETFGLRIDVDGRRFEGSAIAAALDERLFFRAEPFAGLTRQLVREMSRPDAFSALTAEGVLLELLARVARLGTARTAAPPQWLHRASEIVHDTFRSPLTVAAIAQQVGVPATTLARAYRAHFGVGIASRVRELRLELAAQELVMTQTPVVDIALRCGFYDQSHLSNAFRRRYGTTPLEHRRRFGIRQRPAAD